MTELEAPIKNLLRRATTPVSVARIWSRIEVRSRATTRRRPPRAKRVQAFALAAAVLAVAALAAAEWSVAHRPRQEVRVTSIRSAEPARARHRSTPALAAAVAPEQAQPAPSAHGAGAEPPMPSAPGWRADRTTPSPSASWRQLAAEGNHASAYSELGREGIIVASKTASIDDLFALADVARLSGHPADAVIPLEQVVSVYPRDSRAPLADLTLGRVELESLDRPVDAITSIRAAFALGVPAGLAEDAYALLVEACAKAGDRSGARRAYEEYTARFPGGVAAGELRRLVDGP